MRGIYTKRLALMTSVGLMFGIAIGSFFWWQRERATANIAAPSGPDRLAASVTSTRLATFETPNAERERGQARTRELEHSVAAVQAKMVTVQAEITALRHDQAAVVQRSAEAVVTPTRDADLLEQTGTAEDAQRQADAQVQAQAAVIDDTFRREPADTAWAPAAELVLREVLQYDDVTALALVEAECRTTLCRLELTGSPTPAGDTTFAESFRTLMDFLPWSGQGFSRIDNADGESPTAVLYLTREGQGFPPVADQQ